MHRPSNMDEGNVITPHGSASCSKNKKKKRSVPYEETDRNEKDATEMTTGNLQRSCTEVTTSFGGTLNTAKSDGRFPLPRQISLETRIDSLPNSDQECYIHGEMMAFFLGSDDEAGMILTGEANSGKTTAALIYAQSCCPPPLWVEGQDISRLDAMEPGQDILIVDDFLGHCPSRCYDMWKICMSAIEKLNPESYLLIARTCMLRALWDHCAAEVKKSWGIKNTLIISRDDENKYKFISSQSEVKQYLQSSSISSTQPFCQEMQQESQLALYHDIKNIMTSDDVAWSACSLLAVTPRYVDMQTLANKKGPKWHVYASALQRVQRTRVVMPLEIECFYNTRKDIISVLDQFASFSNKAMREAALTVMCESHAETVSDLCCQHLLSQLALATCDSSEDPKVKGKPRLPEKARKAFLVQSFCEMEEQKYQDTLQSDLFLHKSFKEEFSFIMSTENSIEKWLRMPDRNGLPFCFYAGAQDFILTAMLSQLPQDDNLYRLHALVGCCYWGHAKQAQNILQRLKSTDKLNDITSGAPNQLILSAALGDGDEVDWDKAPIYPADTLLTLAAWRGNDEVVKLLLRNGMDVNVQGANKCTALMHYCARANEAMVRYLLEQGASRCQMSEWFVTPLSYALAQPEWNIPHELIQGSPVSVSDVAGDTPLLHACSYGWGRKMIGKLIRNGENPLHENIAGITCFDAACKWGHTRTVRFLLENETFKNAIENRGTYNPLQMALYGRGRLVLVKMLLNLPGMRDAIDEGFWLTACYCYADVLKEIYASVCTSDDTDAIVLQSACGFGNHELFEHLLQNGASLQSPVGETCFHNACRGGTLATVKLLAEKVDCNAKGEEDLTPIMTALRSGRLKHAQFLLERGALLEAVDSQGNTCLHHATASNSAKTLDWCILTNQMDVEAESAFLDTPLLFACSSGKERSVKHLLERGANGLKRDCYGNTCLHLAAQKGFLGVVDILLQNVPGLDVSALNLNDNTALQLAGKGGYASIVNRIMHFASANR